MGAGLLTSRAIRGMYYQRLEQNVGSEWVERIAEEFSSDQASEDYPFLGMSPTLQLYKGEIPATNLRENKITLANQEYMAALEIPTKWIRRDKTQQIATRINDLADRTNAHWASLLSTLLLNAESTVCYDDQYFFDTDHVEGDSGSLSNDITHDIATTTAPTTGEMEGGILKATEQLLKLKDDKGEPINENAKEFLIMVPVTFMSAAAAAIGSQVIIDSSTSRTNTIITMGSVGGFQYRIAVNPRLTWTTKFALFRTDGAIKPLIRQTEVAPEFSAIAEGSETEQKQKKHIYSVYASRAVGYGMWQLACMVTFV